MKKSIASTCLICGICALSCASLSRTASGRVDPLIAAEAARMDSAASPASEWKAWLAGHRLPLESGDSLSFAYFTDEVEARPCLSASWAAAPLPLKRMGTKGLWAIALPRASVPDGGTYAFLPSRDERPELAERDRGNPYIAFGSPLRSMVVSPGYGGATLMVVPSLDPSVPEDAKPRLYARDIYVWLPAGYQSDSGRRWPVLYMHDGQNIWDSPACAWGGWKAETAMGRLAARGDLGAWIIVGIRNTSLRPEEFLGFSRNFGKYGTKGDPAAAAELARQYAAFVARDVKGWADANLRTLPDREHCAIMGSSNGAAVSLHIASLYPETYSRVGLLSGDFLDAEKQAAELPSGWAFRIWQDCGSVGVDEEFTPGNRELNAILLSRGWAQDGDYHWEYLPGAPHNEVAWASRMERVLSFLLK